MSHITIPEGYQSLLGLYDTQKAIGLIKTIFQEKLCMALHLKRVTAPLFVMQGSGLNDDLNGVERPVSFDVPSLNEQAEVVHSLAKWKRYALYKYGFRPGQGIVTDMNAVRRDEELDNLHSIYVDQWDWERVITADQRTLEFLQETVRDIVDAVCATSDELRWKFPELKNNIHLRREVAFITTQELEDRYPDFTPKQRENAFAKEHGTVCIMQIGGRLKSGQPHDGRAPDYDDWTLNCDILFWHKPLDCALELSSMGIRVDADALRRQLDAAGCPQRAELPFHKLLLDGTLPLTMGGGIGQSRLCMLLLGKAHVGEVQVSLWDDATIQACRNSGVDLLSPATNVGILGKASEAIYNIKTVTADTDSEILEESIKAFKTGIIMFQKFLHEKKDQLDKESIDLVKNMIQENEELSKKLNEYSSPHQANFF